MRLHPIRGLTSIQGVGDGGIGATCMVYSDDTPILIKGLAWASKAIYGDRVQICDGVADEVEINAALTAIAAIGGTVLLSEGIFHMVATASVPANCMLRGMGWGSILEYDAGGNCITITGDNAKARDLKVDIVAGAGAGGTRPNCLYAASRTNLELFGLWLIGDETVGDDGSDLRQCGIVFTSVAYSSILNCVSQDHRRHGIRVSTSDDNTLVGNICQGNTRSGIWVSNSDDNTLVDNTCSANTQNGIYGEYGFGNSFTGNTCNGNGLSGIALYETLPNAVTGNACYANTQHGIDLTNVDGSTISGNTCSANTQNGIWLRTGSDSNTVTGNTCSTNGRYGIFLSASLNNTIAGNSCNGNDSGDTGTYDGISLSGSAANLISENTCKDNDRNGILVDADSTQCVIEGNYCGGNGHHGISCAGLDSQINDNRCFDNSQKTQATYHGIHLLNTANDCLLGGNYCDSPGDTQEDGIHVDGGTGSYCSIVGNWCMDGMGSGIYVSVAYYVQLHANYCYFNDDYGIELNATVEAHVKDNLLASNLTGQFLDGGTDTATPEIWAPFAFEDAIEGYRPVKEWLNDADTPAYCTLQIPLDFQELVSVNAVVIPEASGNLRWLANTSFGKICANQQEDAHTDTVAENTQAVTDDELECLDLIDAFTDLGLGDNVGVQVSRIGTHEEDTVDATVNAVGVRLRYV